MGIDLVIPAPCDVRTSLGRDSDDPIHAGGLRLVELLKMRAAADAARAAQPEVPLEEATFVKAVMRPEGVTEETVRVAELYEQCAVLDPLGHHCEDCPANVNNSSFGCVGYMRYPISEATERAIVERFEPLDHLGGYIYAQAVEDFGYDGSPMRPWRERELFESPATLAVKLGPDIDGTGDIFFQALLRVGPELDSFHCALLLIWIGSLAVDNEVPQEVSPEPLQALQAMSDPEERFERVGVLLTEDEPANTLLKFLHRAYLVNFGLLIDG